MKYVKLKSESTSLDEYNKGKKSVKFAKYLVIFLMLVVLMPTGTISSGLSNLDNRKDYFDEILIFLIISKVG